MYKPSVDHIDQLIRFMEVLAKLDTDQRQTFLDALEMILHPPMNLRASDFMDKSC